MIRAGTLLIQKGTDLPASVLLKGDPTDDWTPVEGGAELLQLKAELADAGWKYFYMGGVNQTTFGRSSARMASAIKGLTAKMCSSRCNCLQIDAITLQSWLGIPYWSVSAHCCHIQNGLIFVGGTA